MYKFITWIVLLVMFSLPVGAVDVRQEQIELFETEKIQDAVPEHARQMLADQSPTEDINAAEKLFSIFRQALSESLGTVGKVIKVMLEVLLITVLCQLLDSSQVPYGRQTAALFGTLSIAACCISDVHALIGLGSETVLEISEFSKLLLPVMVSAAAASGSITGAGAVYTLTTAAFTVLVRFCSGLLIPGVYAYLALACADSALEQEKLKRLREFVGWSIEKGLKIMVYTFTGLLTVTGALSGAADTLSLKAAKMTMSGVVPVVGSIISGAAETVFASAAFLKNSIGTYGMLAIFAIFILPFLSIGLSFLLFKLSAALSGILGGKLVSLLDAVSSAMGYLLAMTGSCALIAMLSCCSFLRTLHV